MVQLDSIAFNHDSSAATYDAINLRKNASFWLTVPEWQRGVSVLPEDSTAAYAVAQVGTNTVTIQAVLSCTDPSVHHAWIRAVDAVVDPPPPLGCLGWIIVLIRAILRALFGNVLGEVRNREVTFSAGQTGPLSFELIHTKLAHAVVGPHTTKWRWQYKLKKKDPWVDFQQTEHRIFVILDLPTAPWQQTPYQQNNRQLPWTDVLKYACQWGLGATTQVAAATGVTRGVYQLGPAVVSYDCPGGGSSHYSWGGFDCVAFIDRLQGGFGNGYYVNCSDCATFVSTFANILGCDLWQSRMSDNGFVGFGLNPMLGIGSNTWEPCCHGEPGWGDAFSYHEVGWTAGCTASDRVYDGCLQVDGDADPTAAPHTALLPTDMVFGNTGDGTYRDRLATPSGRPHCNPQPATRQRRAVS
jgi:hypothetical protein